MGLSPDPPQNIVEAVVKKINETNRDALVNAGIETVNLKENENVYAGSQQDSVGIL